MTRAQVIKRLKQIDAYFRESFDAMDGTHICELFHGWSEAAEEAIALLKAQEPRVMTLEEYEAWIDTPFTERNPVFHEELTKRGAVTSWVNTTVCSLREYGKNDRCWTSRPDEATREETPWD